MDLEQIWVRVYGYPLILNEQREYDKLFNPWGAYVLEIDASTNSGYDVRFIRVKLEICDRSLIPIKHRMPYRKPNGQRKLYDLEFEIESDKSETLNAWAGRKGGRPYPNGTEFGQIPPPTSDQQPPPAQPPQGDGGFVFNGSELVLRNTNRVIAFETIHVDESANGDMQGDPMETVEQRDADTEEVMGGEGQHPDDIAGDSLQFPAIEGFPAVPFPWIITIPPCSHCRFEGLDDFLIPTDATAFPPLPNIDYVSDEDITINDLLLSAKPTGKPPLSPSPPSKKKKAVSKFSPKPLLIKKKGTPSGSGISSRLRSASKAIASSPEKAICISDSEQPTATHPSSQTPEVVDSSTATQKELRMSLRMQAQMDEGTILQKAQKRKQGASSSQSGKLKKKIKNYVVNWLHVLEDAIPLNQFMPMSMVVYAPPALDADLESL